MCPTNGKGGGARSCSGIFRTFEYDEREFEAPYNAVAGELRREPRFVNHAAVHGSSTPRNPIERPDVGACMHSRSMQAGSGIQPQIALRAADAAIASGTRSKPAGEFLVNRGFYRCALSARKSARPH